MRLAGANYTYGRESQLKYNESNAGFVPNASGNQFEGVVDPFDSNGNIMPGLTLPDQEIIGASDKKVQAYNFRLCVTTNISNITPWPKPLDYDASKYAMVGKYSSCFSFHIFEVSYSQNQIKSQL